VNRRRRRLGFVLAAVIAALAVGIALYPLIQPGGSGELGWPGIVPRPVVIAALLGLPASLAAIAAFRGSRPIFIAAGVLCLLQSIVGVLSGVTLGFVIPGILLVAIGLERSPIGSPRTRARAWVASVLVVGLGIAAWVAPFATSETVCWIAQRGSDGSPVYTRIPETDTLGVGTGDLASGCDGGSYTFEGLMLAGVLGIGALALAGLAAGSADRPRDPESAPG
jgi:hypothetical protein